MWRITWKDTDLALPKWQEQSEADFLEEVRDQLWTHSEGRVSQGRYLTGLDPNHFDAKAPRRAQNESLEAEVEYLESHRDPIEVDDTLQLLLLCTTSSAGTAINFVDDATFHEMQKIIETKHSLTCKRNFAAAKVAAMRRGEQGDHQHLYAQLLRVSGA